MFYVYLLKSLTHGELYIGSTHDLSRRVKEHNEGKSLSTKRYVPWRLVYYEAFIEESLARMREHNLKHNGNAIRELKKRLSAPSVHARKRQSGAGFTLIETLVATGIMIALLGLILTNYRRGNDDSVLSRETLLLTSRLRLAQEYTAVGQVTGFCGVQNLDAACLVTNPDCTAKGADTCTLTTPSGGYGMFFSCGTGAAFSSNHWPDPNKGQFFMFADRVQCQKSCFPFNWADINNWPASPGNAFVNMDKGTDHLFSSDDWGSYFKGDTIAAQFAFDAKVILKDIQLLEAGATGGKVKCADGSPWTSVQMPGGLDSVPGNYPLQAVIHFPTPDGRATVLSDNVTMKTPTGVSGFMGGQPWKEVDLMLALKARPTVDCRMVRITNTGVITQATDADCQF